MTSVTAQIVLSENETLVANKGSISIRVRQCALVTKLTPLCSNREQNKASSVQRVKGQKKLVILGTEQTHSEAGIISSITGGTRKKLTQLASIRIRCKPDFSFSSELLNDRYWCAARRTSS